MGDDKHAKRSTKGIPRFMKLNSAEFKCALYDPNVQVKRKMNKLQFFKPSGTVAKISLEKRALNGCYSKFFVDDSLVLCTPFE